MASKAGVDVDFIEELKLRRWARENYIPNDNRPCDLHPIILEEMTRKDVEFTSGDISPSYAAAVA